MQQHLYEQAKEHVKVRASIDGASIGTSSRASGFSNSTVGSNIFQSGINVGSSRR